MSLVLVLKYATETSTPIVHSSFRSPYLGPSYTSDACLEMCQAYKDQIFFERMDEDSCIEEACARISSGHIIAWVRGRLEFGPRALGHRSILASPLDPEMRDKINHLIKRREGFRPFAPSVLAEYASDYFDIPEGSKFPYMLVTVPVRHQYRSLFPAITHVNGSARIQTVDKKLSPLYWRLIEAIGKKTGFYLVLNTSFNVKGQPMVCSPRQAIETFISTNVAALYLENYRVVKRSE